MGFRGVALKWLNSYLNMRFQYVESNGVQSSMRKITCGVPQGSVLGPLLFLLYINDLTSLSKTNKCLRFALFADDTTVIFSDPSLKQSTVIAEACFSHIFEWFLANKLLINISKTHYICFGHNFVQHDNVITVCNHRINRVNHTKFLGIYTDEKLTWYRHIDVIFSKLAKLVGMLTVASYYFPHNVLPMMFHAFIISHIRYEILIWGNTFLTYLHPIRVLYNKAFFFKSVFSDSDNILPQFHSRCLTNIESLVF